MDSPTNRRRFHRFPFEAKAVLRIGSQSHIPCDLLDLSLNGALVKVSDLDYYNNGELGELELVIRGEIRGDVVTMNMDVAAVRIENSQLACRITSVDYDSFDSLKTLIEDNLGDVTLLDRELTQLDYWPGVSVTEED